jgi:S-adenosylmethionine-diacylglycerol 3-amino-3-carboxypropyl transferase
MKKNYFSALNYTLGDEDNRPETALLRSGANHILTIAGSGARLIPFLSRRPAEIHCYDIVPEQLYLNELRLEALRKLEVNEYAGFLGYPPQCMKPQTRKNIFHSLTLSTEARRFLQACFENNQWSALLCEGKFEKMLLTLQRINKLLTGTQGAGIFECNNLEEQKEYMRTRFPHAAWKMVLFLLGNSTVLNSILYKGDFPKKNIPGSTYRIYEKIFLRLFERIRARQSFFLQLVFLGKLVYPEGNLEECDPATYSLARNALDHTRVHFICQSVMTTPPTRRYDFVYLSDVPSFLPPESAAQFLRQFKPLLSPAALLGVRGHLRIIRPETSGYTDVSARYSGLVESERTQLWTMDVYQPCVQ